jgi:hypothetical protein
MLIPQVSVLGWEPLIIDMEYGTVKVAGFIITFYKLTDEGKPKYFIISRD